MFHEIRIFNEEDVRVTVYNGDAPAEIGSLLVFNYETCADFYGKDAAKQAKRWVKSRYPSSKVRV